MSTARSFIIDDGISSQLINIPLGSATSRLGVKKVNDMLYPRFTGAFIESSTASTSLASGASDSFILDAPTPLAGRSYTSSDVTYNNVAEELQLPYSSLYRVQILAAYRLVSLSALTNLAISFTATNGASSTVRQYNWTSLTGTGLISVDEIVVCDRIGPITIENLGPNPVNILDRTSLGASKETYVKVTALGII